MVFAVAALGGVCVLLVMQYIRSIRAVRSLYRQLTEIERGSHIELGMDCRQKDVMAL